MAAKKRKRKVRKLTPAERHMRDHYKRYFKNYNQLDENWAAMVRGAKTLGIRPSRRTGG